MKVRVDILLKNSETLSIQKGLKSFSCSENLKGSDMDLKPGYIEQNAEIVFFDHDGSFREQMRISSVGFFRGQRIQVYADDNLLGIYIIDNVDASLEENEVTIYGIDYSFTFENILVKKTGLLPTVTPKVLLDHVFTNSLPGESFIADDEASALMNSITIYNAFILEKTVKEVINNICEVGCVNMFYDKGVFRVARCF